MTCTLDMVPKEDIDKRWDDARPLLEKACIRYGARHGVEDLGCRIKEGVFQLWLMMRGEVALAALTTEIIEWPKYKEMRMVLMIGDEMDEWIGLLPELEEYARGINCAKISGMARPGWEKILTEYRKTHVFLEKDL